MEIVKKLSLNKTPKDVPNGSIVCAKNMMVDDTGSFLTNDIGFKEAVSFEGEHIVGVIPCSSEIVILTIDDNNKSHIYRKSDFSLQGEAPKEVKSNWTYEGGKITGTYTYNYKNELIIVIAESGTGNSIPLKSFIIKEDENGDYYANPNQTYATEEVCPKVNCVSTIHEGGELACGVYTFFIRYEIDKDNYTKWFQLTGDIIIIHPSESKRYTHTYYGDSSNNPLERNILKESFTVNVDGLSTKAIQLKLLVDDTSVLDIGKAQIGYIIKRKADVQGRIEGLYDLTNGLEILIRNNIYLEEVGIDELLENPHQFFNVEHTSNYNNRLYIAGYTEYDNIDYGRYTNVTIQISDGTETNIGVNQNANANVSTPTSISYDFKFRLFCDYPNAVYQRNYYGSDINFYDVRTDIDTNLLLDPTSFIAKLAKYIPIGTEGYGLKFLNGDPDDVFLETHHAVLVINQFSYKDPITGQEYYETLGLYDSQASGTSPSLPLGITMIQNYEIEAVIDEIEPDNSTLYLLYNGKRYDLFGGDTHLNVFIHHQVDNIADESEIIDEVYDITGEAIGDIRTRCAHTVKLRLVYGEGTTIYTDTELPDEDTGVTPSTGVAGSPSSNTRTLTPYQKYNFFIHYIRKDGSCTPGFPIGDKTYNVPYGNLIIPTFTVQKPFIGDFIGYFISYEDVERDTETMLIIDEKDGVISMTNALYEYDLNTLRGSKIIVNDVVYYITPNTLKFIEDRLIENHVEYKTEATIADISDIHTTKKEIGIICFVKSLIEAKYEKTVKTLYRLTPNIYLWDTPISSQDYLPDFYDRQTILAYFSDENSDYLDKFIIDPAIEYVFGVKAELNSDEASEATIYSIRYYFPQMYCKYPTSAMNVKQDFTRIALLLGANRDDSKMVINELVGPDRLHDYLELQPSYQAKPSKSYTNYRKDNISRFDKTVYRSDVISDESLVNGFRHFDPDNYKNILENKGKITNIVGIGFYFIVHTEYSMFVFDRSPKLTKTRQLEIPDTFDIDYQEVMPSNEGFGGLRYKEESILTKNGYIWYDRANNIIFKYENGESQILSADINNFIKYLDIYSVRFAEDIIHNRIFICLKVNISEIGQEDLRWITLSYSFYTNTFISLHDFKFTDNYRTYNKSYVFNNSDVTNNILYEFDENALSDYKALAITTGESWIFPTLLIDGDRYKSYVDIIFNETYEVVKVLNSIHYVLNQIESRFNNIIVSEETLERRFSGDEMRIYTDETNTFDFNINVDKDKLNAIELYDLPAFEKGKWNLNYFRDVINNVGFEINESESDNRRLIYGKYIVVRFIFHNDRKVKLDNVDVDIQLY